MIFYPYCLYYLIFNTNTLEEKFDHINDDLLVKYLLGEATATEEEQVRQWLNADVLNVDYFNQLKQVWDTSRELAATSVADENKAWEKFQRRITEVKEEKSPVASNRFGWMKIAASIIIVAGIGLAAYWMVSKNSTVKEMLVQAGQDVIKDTLPDGSVVTINKGSAITYLSKFKSDTRGIALKGEAFFNVTPDKKKPFIISVNDVQITVVGTSFNVKSSNGHTEIVVETGIVRVTKAGKTIELRAEEKLITTPADTALAKEEVSDHLYNYYRTKEFVCDDTPLSKLVEVLNEAYGVNIIIGRNELSNLRMNTTFYNESLDQVLNVISLTFSIKITREGNKIILQ
ncbi:MAG: FecR domain-containing protein [Bacteroidota bacterium]